MSSRHRAREYVLKALYAFEQGEQASGDLVNSIIKEGRLKKDDFDFALNLFQKAIEKVAPIDEYISGMATNWKIDRLAIVDKNILRIAICEVIYFPDIPMKVAINEAIELAKKFSTNQSASFVNGILDKVMQKELAREQ